MITYTQDEMSRGEQLLYDSVNGVFGVDVNISRVALSPTALQLSATDANTSLQIQAKVHKDAPWVTIDTRTASSPAVILAYPVPYQFVRVVRVGTGDITVHAQL